MDDAIVKFGFDCKVRKLSSKTVANNYRRRYPNFSTRVCKDGLWPFIHPINRIPAMNATAIQPR